METVIFSRQDHAVSGLNRPAGPCEYTLQLPYPITAVKTLQRANGERQKTNGDGQLLYQSNPVPGEDGQETYDEVTTARIPTAWEEVTQEYKLVNEDGSVTPASNTARVPTEWEDLLPIMVPNIEAYQVTFAEQPSLFTYDDLHEAKLVSLEKASPNLRLVYYDEDFEPASFSSELADHAANLGDGIMAIHPGGTCRTVKLQLGTAADTIQLYLEAQEGIGVEVGATVSGFVPVTGGVAELPEPADALYVRFTNTTDTYKEVYAFGILV
ncbi:hypothetical protein SAMN04487895_12710 [Paenibacillus sophorae]|uniref:Uncharacterized protein n=1 Tax=Paenibacillus sophorae TaxID=1333845 RepID=A0A1H8VRF0_9BACL|nr:hypothetical protein [Paenibacillus sophorae]QWU15666.1 hypothetical protein KP014_28260 [Paenibacillus sophorae]SEP17935.1 hypothetical protein SAMN04487895_12710 [Paenibacillus sophorae]